MSTKKLISIVVLCLAILLTMKAALGQLDILDSSVEVTVNGLNVNAAVPMNVSPGDQVTVRFGFQNNYTDRTLGHVQTSALGPFAGFPMIGSCEGTTCDRGFWVLRPGDTGSESFTFTVPSDIDPTIGSFLINLDLTYDNFWGDNAGDSQRLTFDVVRADASIEISRAVLSDDSLSCSNSATLTVELVNRGDLTLAPELLIYDQPAVQSSFNRVTGKFSSFSATPKISQEYTLEPITAGTRVARPIQINTNTLATGSHRLYIYIVNPYFNAANFFVGDTEEVSFTTSACMTSFSPTASTITLRGGATQAFTVTVPSGESALADIRWKLDGTEVATGTSFSNVFSQSGQHTVTVNTPVNQGETHSWAVTVSNRPVTTQFQLPNFDETQDPTMYTGLTVQNSAGSIAFNNAVDLTNAAGLLNLDNVMTIQASKVAVDTTNAPGLAGRAATITLPRGFTTPVILVSSGYNTGDFQVCAAPRCQIISQTATSLVFSVTGFSTYQVVENVAAGLAVSDVLFDNVNRGETVNTTVTITNTGTIDALTGLTASFVNVNARYAARIIGTVPATLNSGQSATVQVQITVPRDEDAGPHSLGTLRVASTQATINKAIMLNPKSLLTIQSVKINSKTNGDLVLDDINHIDVKVKNEDSKDMDSITVKVKILNVNNDDITEESNEFDLNKGDNDEVTVDVDLRGEKVDQDSFTIEITAEGQSSDGTTHRTVQTSTVKLNLENHKVIIETAALDSANLQCNRQTRLQVTTRNVGRSNEDSVKIQVMNSALSIDATKDNIKLDKFTGSDNEDKASFTINAGTAAVGTYPLTVEVFRDNQREDSKDVSLEIKSCSTAGTVGTTAATVSQTTQTQAQLAGEDLTKLLAEQLNAKKTAGEATEIKASFRDSDTYLFLLGAFVVMILIAVVLGVVIMLVRK